MRDSCRFWSLSDNLNDSNLNRSPSTKSYEYSLSYIRSLSPSSEAAAMAATKLIVSALNNPHIFDFDPLFKLDAVVALRGDDLFALLQVFLNDGLVEFQAWGGSFEKYGVSTFLHFFILFFLSVCHRSDALLIFMLNRIRHS